MNRDEPSDASVADEAAQAESRRPHHVQSLARGLSVMTAFGPERPQLTLTEVARHVGLTRAAARRFLLTLVDLGYVRSDGRHFSLTPRVLELGYAYLSSLSLPELAQPHLERLSAAVHESSSVSVLDGHEVVYVARVATSRIMTVAIDIGTRFPAYATSMGRVLLAGLPDEEVERRLHGHPMDPLTPRTITDLTALRAELDRVRRRGWALVDQELEPGLRSIAAPIRNRDGEVVAAINVSTHAARTTLERMRRDLLPPLQQAAAAIGSGLDRTATRRRSS